MMPWYMIPSDHPDLDDCIIHLESEDDEAELMEKCLARGWEIKKIDTPPQNQN